MITGDQDDEDNDDDDEEEEDDDEDAEADDYLNKFINKGGEVIKVSNGSRMGSIVIKRVIYVFTCISLHRFCGRWTDHRGQQPRRGTTGRWRTTTRNYEQHLGVSFYVQTGHVSRLDLLSFQAGQLHVSVFYRETGA